MSSDEFDPYRKWLGIAPGQRPPTHYDLLGISLDEDDYEVVNVAAERQMTFVKSQLGKGHDEAVHGLVYQIQEAQITLKDTEARRDYDQRLKLFQKRRKKRQVDPTGAASGLPPRVGGHQSVGEGSDFLRSYAGVVGVLVIAFGAMLWWSFRQPWSEPPRAVADADAPNALFDAITDDGSEIEANDDAVAESVEVVPNEANSVVALADEVAPTKSEASSDSTDESQGETKAEQKPFSLAEEIKEIAPRRDFAEPGATLALAVHPSNDIVATCGSEDVIRLYRLPLVKQFAEITHPVDHPAGVVAIKFSPDGSFLISSGADGSIRLWNVFSEEPRLVQRIKDSDVIQTAVVFSPDGTRVAIGERGGDVGIRLYDFNDQLKFDRLLNVRRGPIWAMTYDPDGQSLVFGTKQEGFGHLWRTDLEGQTVTKLAAFESGIPPKFLTASPKGEFLATSDGPDIVLVERDTGATLLRHRGHRNPRDGDSSAGRSAQSVDFTSDGQHIVSSGYDGSVRVWESATGKEVEVLSDRLGGAEGAVFIEKHRLVVAAFKPAKWTSTQFNGLHVWKLEGGEQKPSVSKESRRSRDLQSTGEAGSVRKQTVSSTEDSNPANESFDFKTLRLKCNAEGQCVIVVDSQPRVNVVELPRSAFPFVEKIPRNGLTRATYDFSQMTSVDQFRGRYMNNDAKAQFMRNVRHDRQEGVVVLAVASDANSAKLPCVKPFFETPFEIEYSFRSFDAGSFQFDVRYVDPKSKQLYLCLVTVHGDDAEEEADAGQVSVWERATPKSSMRLLASFRHTQGEREVFRFRVRPMPRAAVSVATYGVSERQISRFVVEAPNAE